MDTYIHKYIYNTNNTTSFHVTYSTISNSSFFLPNQSDFYIICTTLAGNALLEAYMDFPERPKLHFMKTNCPIYIAVILQNIQCTTSLYYLPSLRSVCMLYKASTVSKCGQHRPLQHGT